MCLLAAACGNRAALDARIGPSSASDAAVVGDHGTGVGVWGLRHNETFWLSGPGAAGGILRTIFTGGFDGRVLRSPSVVSPPEAAGQPSLATAALAFRGMARVSDAKISALAPVKLESPAEHLTFEPAKNEDLIICQSMANLTVGAAMDVLRKSPKTQSRDIRILERLEGAVTRITGRDFHLDVTQHPEVSLRVSWGGVMMTLQQLPDGLRAIIGWLVSCVSKLNALFPDHPDPLSLPLILLLDEPEGHLHPAWQRKVLPAAQVLFPQAQIFAATHSPFVISSVNEGWIHILRANEPGVVTVNKPRECSKGDTYLDVVEDILGVKEWYDPETEDLLAKFRAMRDDVLVGREEYSRLEGFAKALADRSDSLGGLMAREMRQVERLQTPAASCS
ncbi:MAG: AAA family ATPase [Planctomycetota bacterium]|nr:AAA family ATPase [Planctomycetota bacterium]